MFTHPFIHSFIQVFTEVLLRDAETDCDDTLEPLVLRMQMAGSSPFLKPPQYRDSLQFCFECLLYGHLL